MNLQPDAIVSLKALLLPIDNADRTLGDLASKIGQATSAASRLEGQIADLNEKMAEVSGSHIKPDAARVAALIAGTEVSQPDKKDIEARAIKKLAIEAGRHQAAEDLAEVRIHMANLEKQAEAERGKRDQAHLGLLSALGEAYMDAYKRDAIEFIRSHVPPLHSLANAIGAKTGEAPLWWGLIAGILRIHWHEPSQNERFPDLVNVWPRIDGTLVSGEAMASFGGVEGLISDLRQAK